MYQSRRSHQVTMYDFNQFCGMPLDTGNEWIRLAECIDWDVLEARYAAMFPSSRGRKAKPLRMALGAMIVQSRLGLTDRALTELIAKDPYVQFFLGLEQFTDECPFGTSTMSDFRRRITWDFLCEANDLLLASGGPDEEAAAENSGEPEETVEFAAVTAPEIPLKPLFAALWEAGYQVSERDRADIVRYRRTLALQDCELRNTAREHLEAMIDELHGTYRPWRKPRTFRRVAGREYEKFRGRKNPSEEDARALAGKQLGYLRRDLKHIRAYQKAGYALPEEQRPLLEHIEKYYLQQQYLYDNRTQSLDDRITSPEPAGEGVAGKKTACYAVIRDERGYAKFVKWDEGPAEISRVMRDALQGYRNRAGRWPVHVIADPVWRTKENRKFCRNRGIRFTVPEGEGRLAPDRLLEGGSGAAVFRTDVSEALLASAAMSVYLANLFGTPGEGVEICCFRDCGDAEPEAFLTEFESN
ncbi:MAG: transposase [Mogibacterium sp.]|nr:transposase [Mogibacterium sp.]